MLNYFKIFILFVFFTVTVQTSYGIDEISDPYEMDFPNIGMFKVEDSETGDTFWVDTSNHSELKQMNNTNRKKNDDFINKSKKLGIDIISISTSDNYIDPLMKFFKKRGEK